MQITKLILRTYKFYLLGDIDEFPLSIARKIVTGDCNTQGTIKISNLVPIENEQILMGRDDLKMELLPLPFFENA